MPDAVRAFVGNFKGPKGEQGPQGIQGPTGPQGIQGPAGPSNADGIDTVDTLGVLVSAGESTDLQRLIDAIADKVMTKLLAKTDIVQVESTATNKVPSSAYLKQVKDSIDSNLNDGKYWRAYTTTFAFGREIPAGKDMTFDLNISFPARPSVLVIIPSTAKITNVRYDFDNSTSTKTRIIFDNEGATIPADAMVRMGVIAIK